MNNFQGELNIRQNLTLSTAISSDEESDAFHFLLLLLLKNKDETRQMAAALLGPCFRNEDLSAHFIHFPIKM